MDAQVATTYVTRDGDIERDRDAVLAIWRGNLGDDSRMPAKYAWFYQHAAAGAPLLQLLSADGRDVGACAAGRRRMLRDGEPLRAGVMVDLAVLPEHRSLGPALMLQQGLARSAGQQLDLLYGFPNPKAAPIFKRVGYRHLADLVRMVRVLRHGPYLTRRLPAALAGPVGAIVDGCLRMRDAFLHPGMARITTSWHDSVDSRMEALWRASRKPGGLVSVRDTGHLQWRFERAPVGEFRYLLLNGPGKHALTAWFAVRAVDGTLHVHDYWSLHGPALSPVHVASLLRAARRAGHSAVSVELATSPAHAAPWRALGFVERGKRPVYARWSDPSMHDAAVDLHLTAADEDE